MQLHPADPYLERKDFTPAEVIDTLKNISLEFEPGTQFRYSNSGYFLLGYMIERVSGEPYHKYLEDHIFSPLGLHHTFYNLPGEVIPGHVYGYKNETGRFEKADFWSATLPYAAGGLVSNVEDLYKWQLSLKDGKLLKKETIQSAFTSYVLKDGTLTGYGYGWYVNGQGSTMRISHGGAITGFRTSVLYYPNQDLFIALLSNCECTLADDLAISISDVVLGKDLQPNIDLPDSISSRYIGTYFMTKDPKRIIVIQKDGDHLAADIIGQGIFRLLFRTETTFELKGVLDIRAEFKTEAGKISGLTVHQHGDFEWRKRDQ
jgi:CubicO group peptidase (beta-lactamase class C family)